MPAIFRQRTQVLGGIIAGMDSSYNTTELAVLVPKLELGNERAKVK